jgi:hypothetical protein
VYPFEASAIALELAYGYLDAILFASTIHFIFWRLFMDLISKVQVARKIYCDYRGGAFCPFVAVRKDKLVCRRFGGVLKEYNKDRPIKFLRVDACKIKHGDKVFVKIDDTE